MTSHANLHFLKTNNIMKKLMMLTVLLGTLIGCQQEQEISNVDLEQNEIQQKSISDLAAVLAGDEEFDLAYNKSLDKLRSAREELTQKMNLKELGYRDGMLVLKTAEVVQPIYEQIVKTDSIWQKTYGDEVQGLTAVASGNEELTDEVEDQFSFYIQDRLEEDHIGFYDLQENIATRMPIKTLWAKVRNETKRWLDGLDKNPNWKENPDDRYAADTYARLFLNEESMIEILGEKRVFDTQESISERAQKTQGAGCRTFWMTTEYTDNTGEPTCLRMRCYVNNFWIWKSYGVNAKGWIWSGGRWREWGFNKFLTQGGNIVTHGLRLNNPCDPRFSRNVNWSRRRTNVEFSISRTLWGPRIYLGACRGSFRGAVTGRGRGQGAIMN